MKIQVYLRSVYGRQTIYPFCEMAKVFAALTNKKTLSKMDVDKIKKLGYTVETVADPGHSIE
jgi:hypothetical protein